MNGVGRRAATRSARAHALAVLRVRSTVLGLALLPAAAAVILIAGNATGHFGAGWDTARWAVTGLGLAVLACAVSAGLVIARARPAVSPTVPVDERSAPDLYAMVRDLAERLDVPVPSAIALTPDCDSWLEDRTHPAQTPASGTPAEEPGGRRGRAPGGTGAGSTARAEAPVLVIGSPFLWWMRVAELRALLAPVVAGTGPSVHPDIAAARRFVRGLDAAVAGADKQQGPPGAGRPRLSAARLVGPLARLMLRAAGPHVTQMERGVAAAASERAQSVDYGLRVVAQEQVGLAYAGWDRLLTRVALPAWRLGLWPTRLDAGVVSALTELSRRDRLAEGFTSRLGERPACDLLEEPGTVDAAVSLFAARLFLGATPPLPMGSGPGAAAPEWTPVEWSAYPEEVVDRIWRTEAARLFAALDATRPTCAPSPEPDPAAAVRPDGADAVNAADGAEAGRAGEVRTAPSAADVATAVSAADVGTAEGAAHSGRPPGTAEGDHDHELTGPTLSRVLDRFASPGETEALAARISADVARAEAMSAPGAIGATPGAGVLPGAGETHPAPPAPMGLPLQPPRSGRELLTDHITAAVCCAAVDTAGAAPGLDWLDGPTLLVEGERRSDLSRLVLALVEEGDSRGLRDWLAAVGVRPDKPVRLV
ncbi:MULTISPECIES: hypothetical protein [unclassified Streptomyces]|uniref:hypothetical protein n=1 Tax=unclassified Streptomyces TaxID=2593676 RepID=UPI002DD8EAEA|nr:MULTISPECIES: hypothetical protein [unclassified Streptomyces]WSA93449.1 hypothetical protein OIE63_19105 [Streptomyces sp. NBC_01795]WSS13934.1 hypothetical protein OG533_20115 [Streptomyces sp. NBC_01186]WSS42747.1 hypothetical protein OG220_20790 [Streptomyces sp. NBC_01187]